MLKHWSHCFIFCVYAFFCVESTFAAGLQEEPEIQLVDIYLNNWLLQLAVPAYVYKERLYLPLKELADHLGLASELDLSPAIFHATAVAGHSAFSLIAQEEQLLYQQENITQIWPAESWLPEMLDFDFDFFIQDRYLAQLWPLELHFNPRRLRLDLTATVAYPQLEARLRALEREVHLRRRAQQSERGQAAEGLPYAVFSPPLVEWVYSHQLTQREQITHWTLRHDLLGLGHEWQVRTEYQGRDDAPEIQLRQLRWKANYTAAEAGSPQPLLGVIQHLEVGDVRQQMISGVGSSSQGRGINVSSFPNSTHHLFDLKLIEGQAPPGWEADLYLNNQLVAHQIVDDSGRYEFDVLLEQGNNQINVRLYGPFGETRVDRYLFQMGQDFLPQGQWALAYGFVEPGVTVFDLEENGLSRGIHDPLYQQHLKLGYGIQTGLGWTGHLFHQQMGEEEHWLGGWTLAGSHFGWQWRWQQLMEGQAQFSHLQALYAYSSWQWQFSAAHHPNWPVFERQNKTLQSRFSLGSRYFLQNAALPLRLELNLSREDHSTYQLYELASSQRLRLGFWDLNLNQNCKEYSTTRPRFCTLETRGIYQKGGVRLSLAARGQYQQEWQSARMNTQMNYQLGQHLYRAHFPSWMRGLRVGAEYRVAHHFHNQNTQGHLATYLTWQHVFDRLTAGVRLDWIQDHGFEISMQLRGHFLPGQGRYHAFGERLQRPVQVTVFHDDDYTGVLSEENSVLHGVRLIQGSRASRGTNQDGQTWLDLHPRLALDLDLRSVDDPYQVSGRPSYYLASRPERVVYLTWPLIDTGSLEGVLLSPLGQPIANQKLTLFAAGESQLVSTMYTGFDGFWVFEFLPPGDYIIYLNETDNAEDQGRKIAEVTLTADNLWLTLDLILE